MEDLLNIVGKGFSHMSLWSVLDILVVSYIFYKGYIHGGADYDYAMMVARHGYSAFITEKVCGQCEYDHKKGGEVIADFR